MGGFVFLNEAEEFEGVIDGLGVFGLGDVLGDDGLELGGVDLEVEEFEVETVAVGVLLATLFHSGGG